MAGLVMTGIIFLTLLGLIRLTDRIDRYWSRRKITTMLPRAKPASPARPFRTAEDQCVNCGRDDGPLSIDTQQCFWCFEKAYG